MLNQKQRNLCMKTPDKIAVMYSLKQGFFDICSLQKAIESNSRWIAKGKEPSYTIIGVCNSYESAGKFCDWWLKSGYAHNFNRLNYLF